jgi:hypothetical protein
MDVTWLAGAARPRVVGDNGWSVYATNEGVHR